MDFECHLVIIYLLSITWITETRHHILLNIASPSGDINKSSNINGKNNSNNYHNHNDSLVNTLVLIILKLVMEIN